MFVCKNHLLLVENNNLDILNSSVKNKLLLEKEEK